MKTILQKPAQEATVLCWGVSSSKKWWIHNNTHKQLHLYLCLLHCSQICCLTLSIWWVWCVFTSRGRVHQSSAPRKQVRLTWSGLTSVVYQSRKRHWYLKTNETLQKTFALLLMIFFSSSFFSSGFPSWPTFLWDPHQLLHHPLAGSPEQNHRLSYPLPDGQWWKDQGREAAPLKEPLHSNRTHSRHWVPGKYLRSERIARERATQWKTEDKYENFQLFTMFIYQTSTVLILVIIML